MKLVSWNVNGLRACMNKGFDEVMGSDHCPVGLGISI
ncbi:hypothetical protein Psfp_02729 [Pelotomaculum sp. FP]|nr:hypothetical protein Psfp_02729 [Pelotomaculum sp. FP]